MKKQWTKNYRKWLFWIGLIGTILTAFFSNFSNSILFTTAVIIFWYTRETFDQKQISNKQLKETRKQVDIQLAPYLRLQWNNDKNKYVYDVINEGQGLAVDVEFEPLIFKDQDIKSTYKIKSRLLISQSKPSTITTDELNNEMNIIRDISIKGYLEDKLKYQYQIKATYKDIEGRKYRVVFKADNSYNDRFKIVEQGRTNV